MTVNCRSAFLGVADSPRVCKDAVWYAQLTVDLIGGGTEQKNVPLRDVRTEQEAEAKTRRLAARAAKQKFEPRSPLKLEDAILFDDYLTSWLRARRAAGLATVDKDKQRLTDYALPHLTGKTMLSLEQDDQPLRDVVAALDRRVADSTIKFGASTARKVWEAVTNLFGTAATSNDKDLLKRSPTRGIQGPRAGRKKEKQWLFPREFERAIACTDAPLAWRRAYAVATYLFSRVAELRALQCEDIDLEAGMVRVHWRHRPPLAPPRRTPARRRQSGPGRRDRRGQAGAPLA